MYNTTPFFTEPEEETFRSKSKTYKGCKITVNEDIDEYFGLRNFKSYSSANLGSYRKRSKIDIVCNVTGGGGVAGQEVQDMVFHVHFWNVILKNLK